MSHSTTTKHKKIIFPCSMEKNKSFSYLYITFSSIFRDFFPSSSYLKYEKEFSTRFSRKNYFKKNSVKSFLVN